MTVSNQKVKRGQALGHRARRCHRCGCTELNACIVKGADGQLRGCAWVTPSDAPEDVCTACFSEGRASAADLINSALVVVDRAAQHGSARREDEMRCAATLLMRAIELLPDICLDRICPDCDNTLSPGQTLCAECAE